MGELINPVSFRLGARPEDRLQDVFTQLAWALKRRRLALGKSEADIQIGAGLQDRDELNPILRGRPRATLARFLEACEGLLRNLNLPGPEGWVDPESLRRLAREILSELVI